MFAITYVRSALRVARICICINGLLLSRCKDICSVGQMCPINKLFHIVNQSNPIGQFLNEFKRFTKIHLEDVRIVLNISSIHPIRLQAIIINRDH